MATPSDIVPDVLPSQVLSVSPSLPTNKLLDNLTVNIYLFCCFSIQIKICLEKSKTFTNITTKL